MGDSASAHFSQTSPDGALKDLLGLHLRGKISLGMTLVRGTAIKAKPSKVCPAMTREMEVEPGMMAAPMMPMDWRPTIIHLRI